MWTVERSVRYDGDVWWEVEESFDSPDEAKAFIENLENEERAAVAQMNAMAKQSYQEKLDRTLAKNKVLIAAGMDPDPLPSYPMYYQYTEVNLDSWRIWYS